MDEFAEVTLFVLAQTEAAWKVTEDEENSDTNSVWLPKSLIEDDSEMEIGETVDIQVATWKAKQAGWI